jgi:hypothetical protein
MPISIQNLPFYGHILHEKTEAGYFTSDALNFKVRVIWTNHVFHAWHVGNLPQIVE